MRILLAVRVFFLALFSRSAAEQIRGALEGAPGPRQIEETPTARPKKAAPRKRPVRSESVTLLATLQREARFIDFIKEPLEGFTDAQIGAAARDVHRDCAAVLDRLFGITASTTDSEGSEVEVGAGFDPGLWKLTGNVQGEPPYRGHLSHHGWKVTQCELPEWSGSDAAARVLAPVEVELK